MIFAVPLTKIFVGYSTLYALDSGIIKNNFQSSDFIKVIRHGQPQGQEQKSLQKKAKDQDQ